MKSLRIGINGFGRIGRNVFRVLAKRSHIEVVAINDISSPEHSAYLLKYDTIMGPLAADVGYDAKGLLVDGKSIPVTAIKDPAQLQWGSQQVDIVVEATGRFVARADLQKHLQAGAKRVLLTVPPKDEIDNMVVLGVNDHTLTAKHELVSNASCTTNCLAPIAKILDDTFGINQGMMTTIHAYTNDQRLHDMPHKDLRRSRAAAENIIPTTTGAARAVGKVLPHLKGKLDGMAARVPVPDGSIVDLVVLLNKPASKEQINQAVAKAATGALKGIVRYSEDPLVSSDIVGDPHSSIFDAVMTQSQGDGYARVVAWYDNEWGYSNRCGDLLQKMGHLLAS